MLSTLARPALEDARTYECMLLLPAILSDGERKKVLESVEALIKEKNGTILRAGEWERRGLAYGIGGHAEGRYAVIHFTLKPEDLREFDVSLRLERSVLRHLIVKVPDGHEPIDYDERFREWLRERDKQKEERAREREEETKKKIIRKVVQKEIKEQKEEKEQKEAGGVVSLEEELGKIISDEDLNL